MMNQNLDAVRELMLAVEFMRAACEHAEGATAEDRDRLAMAMAVGMRVNAKHAALLPDYQHRAFWDEVRKIPVVLGLRAASAAAAERKRLGV